jgi:hypothetical protein
MEDRSRRPRFAVRREKPPTIRAESINLSWIPKFETSYQGTAKAQYSSLKHLGGPCEVDMLRFVTGSYYRELRLISFHPASLAQTPAGGHPLLQNLGDDAAMQRFPTLRGE